ncbi:hypothetical protein RRG08_054834 [Elysia crispata]|uniref:Uncharacterized protein n=1 Tax=Elysia crispata TaxID=231223 RepID=A0AAE1A535_9GAST|nr:hypothetical protein RRG08_054834 [Elysia crispata]
MNIKPGFALLIDNRQACFLTPDQYLDKITLDSLVRACLRGISNKDSFPLASFAWSRVGSDILLIQTERQHRWRFLTF